MSPRRAAHFDRYGVFPALLVGTGLTVGVAFVDLGAMNNVLMLGIAMTKALLVILFFMHVRWEHRPHLARRGLGEAAAGAALCIWRPVLSLIACVSCSSVASTSGS